MGKKVENVSRVIRCNRFDLLVSRYVFHQYLLPCIRGGLLVASIPKETVKQWDSVIRTSVCQAARAQLAKSVGDAPFRVLIGIPRLELHRWVLRGTELLVTCNSRGLAADTCRLRVAAGPTAGKAPCRARDTSAALAAEPFHAEVGPLPRSLARPAFDRPARPGAWDPTSNAETGWRPWDSAVCVETRAPAPGWERVDAFTDGSYDKFSGCGVVIVPSGGASTPPHDWNTILALPIMTTTLLSLPRLRVC